MFFAWLIVFVAPFVVFASVPASLSDTVTGKYYGSTVLTFTSGSTSYLLVSEGGGTNALGVDIYSVSSTAVTQVKRHAGLAAQSYQYNDNAFRQDGTNLFVLGEMTSGPSVTYNIYTYPLSSLTTTVTVPSPFTMFLPNVAVTSFSVTYKSSTPAGYVAISGNGMV